jgi:hypothetical protein
MSSLKLAVEKEGMFYFCLLSLIMKMIDEKEMT